MNTRLSDTLELRGCVNEYLQGKDRDPCLADPVLGEFERFLERMRNGPFRLGTEAEFEDHRSALQKALAAVCGAEPQRVEISLVSMASLQHSGPKGQMLVYTVASQGSVGVVLHSNPIHACHKQEALLPVMRAVRTALMANDLVGILRDSMYGLSFSRVFAEAIVTFFACIFVHACEGNFSVVEQLLPLAKFFRANMPIGLLPRLSDRDPFRWQVLVLHVDDKRVG